jgi:hypothetical protein
MINQTRKTRVQGFLLALAFILGLSSVSWGAEYWLRAETLTKTMPVTNEAVTMWGFAQCIDGTYASCTPATVPGPRLTVPVGDTVLTIHLINNLTGPLIEPVSLVIPGQTIVPTPVRNLDGRVRSFTAEAPPDNATTVTYSWANMKPGTYLYQSGSHPAVQVQMGLYGAVTMDFAVGQAYGPSTAFAAEALLLFSEIDPVLHSQVADGSYGTTGMTSTMNYEPKYFLINGEPFSATSTPLPAGNAGSNVLLRFLNAGLQSHVPVIQGTHLSIVSEDGNTYPFAKRQYSLLLPAGKTTDAIFTPTTSGTYAIYDRRLALTNGAATGGGLLVNLGVGAGTASMAVKIGIFRDGQWYLDTNGNGGFDSGIDSISSFGIPGDKPVTGDWTGTGTAKVGIFRDGEWYLDTNGNLSFDAGIDFVTSFGLPGDIPVTGDWTGSGTTKIGVVRGTEWYLDINGNGVWDVGVDTVYAFGIPGDVPVTGDWNGSGSTKIGIYRSGEWYLDQR